MHPEYPENEAPQEHTKEPLPEAPAATEPLTSPESEDTPAPDRRSDGPTQNPPYEQQDQENTHWNPQGQPYGQNGAYQQNPWNHYGPNGPYQQGGPYQQNQWYTQNQGGPYRQGPYPYRRPGGMATAALILGILAITASCCGIGGLIFGSIGIVMAILSRGMEPMEASAKIGLGLSIAGMVLGALLLIASFVLMTTGKLQYETLPPGYHDMYDGYGSDMPYDWGTYGPGNGLEDWEDYFYQ